MFLRTPLTMKTTVGCHGWLVQPCIAFFRGMFMRLRHTLNDETFVEARRAPTFQRKALHSFQLALGNEAC